MKDVIKLAREAGADTRYYGVNMNEGMGFYNHDDLTRFAALIQAQDDPLLRECLKHIVYAYGDAHFACRETVQKLKQRLGGV